MSQIKIGYIYSHHGIKGAVKGFLETDNPDFLIGKTLMAKKTDDDLGAKEEVFDKESEKSICIKINKISKQKRNYIFIVDGFESFEKSEDLLKRSLHIDESEIPHSDTYYHYELINMKIYQNGENLGVVKKTYNFGAGDIVENESGEMFLLDQIDLCD